MRQLNIRIEDTLYESAKEKSSELSISLSDLIRNAIKHVCSNGIADKPIEDDSPLLPMLKQELDKLHNELATKNQQIEELHKLVAMAQSNAISLTDQLDRANLQLEDVRGRSWWQRFFRK